MSFEGSEADFNEWFDDDDRPAINYKSEPIISTELVDLCKDDGSDTTIVYYDDGASNNSESTVEFNLSSGHGWGTGFGLPTASIENGFSSLIKGNFSNIDAAQPLNSLQPNSLSQKVDSCDLIGQSLLPTKKNNNIVSNEEKKRKKMERERIRNEKKAEQMREKNLKASMASHLRNLKPEEALKRLTVHIDTQIVNSFSGTNIIPALQKESIKYSVESLNIPNTIIWTKLIKEPIMDDCEQFVEKEHVQQEHQLVEIFNWVDFVSLVSKNQLLQHVNNLRFSQPDSRLTLIVVGMEKYFCFQSNQINRAMKTAILGSQHRSKKADTALVAAPVVTKEEVEMALTELQLLTDCCYRNVESAEEVAAIVFQMTRSISQIEYKHEQFAKEKNSLSWYAKADGKGCVKVDKNGNGLLELWQQQICQFNSVGIEVAQAVVSQYQSPQSLLAAYQVCENNIAASDLLQNIAVRRDAGILSSSRRVGPELSRKIHRYFTSTDPNHVI